MRITKKSGLVAGGLAGALMLIASAAYAAGTVIVDGSAAVGQVAVTGVNKGTISFKTTTNEPGSCAGSSTVGGKINRGASATSGTVIGQIDNFALSVTGFPCTLTWIGLPVTIEKSAKGSAPWEIELTATPVKGAATAPIVIRDMDLTAHSLGAQPWLCDLKLAGDVTGTFDQTTQQISINTPPSFPLDITTYTGSGSKLPAPITCAGLITTTQFASMVGSFTLSTPGVGGIHW